MKFTVLTAKTKDELEKLVSRARVKGWEPIGDSSVYKKPHTGTVLVQSMTKAG